MELNWSLYPNFTQAELACKHTGRCDMHPEFMEKLQQVRNLYNRPMRVSSGFRDRSHPVEVNKTTTGEHVTGRAVDIAIQGREALELVRIALIIGFPRIGVQQKGAGRFIHLGDNPAFPPGIWSY
jgi:zinc D-Ala-D-Ala carboxypeptidase